jgi:hypothetical protein
MGVYTTEQKAREEGESQPLSEGLMWSIVPVELDSPRAFREDTYFFDERGDSRRD